MPAAFRHVTEGVAGEDIGDTSNLVCPNATKPSTQSCDWMQLRMRLPREFAEILLAFKSEKRAVALWLALEDRIGDVWDLPKLIKSSANLWTAGTLLNRRLRDIGLGGHDWVQLKLAVSMAVRAIKKLRTDSAPTENPANARMPVSIRIINYRKRPGRFQSFLEMSDRTKRKTGKNQKPDLPVTTSRNRDVCYSLPLVRTGAATGARRTVRIGHDVRSTAHDPRSKPVPWPRLRRHAVRHGRRTRRWRGRTKPSGRARR